MAKFEACFESFAKDFKSFSDEEKNLAIEKILLLCEPQQLHILSDQLPNLVKRDFIRFLPIELVFHVIKYLDYKTLGRCCKVSKSWNSILSNYPDIWESWCASVGVLNSQKLTTSDVNWKLQLQEGLGRLQRLEQHFFPKRNLVRHTDSVRALCYNDGFLATGSYDRNVRLWNVESGMCIYNLTCHTCADLKFDDMQVVTASYDNTVTRWEWKTGNCLTMYEGHVAAVFCVDYNVELDLVASGSADCTVKFWQMSTGSCLATKLGHQDWLINVLIAKIAPDYQTKLHRKHIAISMSRDCIKVWSVSVAEEYNCIATLSSSSTICPVNYFHPKLLCNGYDIMCSSDKGVCIWNLENFQLKRLFEKHNQYLLAYGDIFTLCWTEGKLHVLHNKTEKCLNEIRAVWQRDKSWRTECAGETAWLNDCSPKLEHGPMYFSAYGQIIVVVQWDVDSTNPKVQYLSLSNM